MKKTRPLISIVMPYYNSSKFIRQAIWSTLRQSFKDFELILIDDGSQDNSADIANSFKDERIIHVHRKHDYISSLNTGLDIATGKFIARMDADDIMHPDRLLVQSMLLERNSNIDFCSSWCTVFNDYTGETYPQKTRFGHISNPLVSLLLCNCFVHPSMMFRRNFIEEHKLRYKQYKYAEDYKLWADAAIAGAKFYTLPQLLLFYRFHNNQISELFKEEQNKTGLIIREEIMNAIIPQTPLEIQATYERLSVLEHKDMIPSEAKYSIMHTIMTYNDIIL